MANVRVPSIFDPSVYSVVCSSTYSSRNDETGVSVQLGGTTCCFYWRHTAGNLVCEAAKGALCLNPWRFDVVAPGCFERTNADRSGDVEPRSYILESLLFASNMWFMWLGSVNNFVIFSAIAVDVLSLIHIFYTVSLF